MGLGRPKRRWETTAKISVKEAGFGGVNIYQNSMKWQFFF